MHYTASCSLLPGKDYRWSCVEPGVGLDDPYRPLPTWDSLCIWVCFFLTEPFFPVHWLIVFAVFDWHLLFVIVGLSTHGHVTESFRLDGTHKDHQAFSLSHHAQWPIPQCQILTILEHLWGCWVHHPTGLLEKKFFPVSNLISAHVWPACLAQTTLWRRGICINPCLISVPICSLGPRNYCPKEYYGGR